MTRHSQSDESARRFLTGPAFLLAFAFLWASAIPGQAQVSEDNPVVLYHSGGVIALKSQDAAAAYGEMYGVKLEPGIYVYTKDRQLRPAISGGLTLIGQGVAGGDFGAAWIGVKALFAGLTHSPAGILVLALLTAGVVWLVTFWMKRRRRAA